MTVSVPEDKAGVARPDLKTCPAMPVIQANEHYGAGTPFLLSWSGPRQTIGWEFRSARKGGPCFVVARNTVLGSTKVLDRFPLTDKGWERAWGALVRLDRAGAEKALAALDRRAAADRAAAGLKALNASTLCRLSSVGFLGGDSRGAGLNVQQLYDLRFMQDRLIVVQPGLVDVVLALPYDDIEAVDVGGPGLVRNYSAGQAIGLTMLFGELGEIAALSSTRIQTVVRVQATACELFFLDTAALADTRRVQLSVPLRLIREARPVPAAASGQPGDDAPESAAGQLTRLASLLAAGLLTSDEFELLKAKIIGS